MKKTFTHGGKRVGAGRPLKPSIEKYIARRFTLPPDVSMGLNMLVDKLNQSQDNTSPITYSGLVTELIKEKIKRTKIE